MRDTTDYRARLLGLLHDLRTEGLTDDELAQRCGYVLRFLDERIAATVADCVRAQGLLIHEPGATAAIDALAAVNVARTDNQGETP